MTLGGYETWDLAATGEHTEGAMIRPGEGTKQAERSMVVSVSGVSIVSASGGAGFTYERACSGGAG